MAVCSIHYREYAWDNYEGCLDVRVNLTDLYLGNEALASEDAFEPDPQIRDITEQLSPAERRALFACLQRLRLGFVAEPLMGLDGADYEITIQFGPQCSITCCWWTELPAEWEGLREIIRILGGAEEQEE
jgi:hypothetical protein